VRITITIDVDGGAAAPVVRVQSGERVVAAPLTADALPAFSPDTTTAGFGPKPPDPRTNVQAAEEARRQAKLVSGYEKFQGLIWLWQQNFDAAGEQPDRAQAIRDLAQDGAAAGAVLTYIRACGGLRSAARACLGEKFADRADPIAENMAQVSSALALPDLADLLEPNHA
jgi:hypothetical protein